MSDLTTAARRSVADNMGLILSVLSIILAVYFMNNSFRNEMIVRFEAVDQRFDAVDRRFEAIDRRFETIDAEFVRVNDRLYELNDRMSQFSERMARVETAVLGYEAPEAARTPSDGDPPAPANP